MVRLGPIALIVILSSAAAATACCFFKCCYKSAAFSDGQVIGPASGVPFSGTVGTLRIAQVAGQTPDSTNNILRPVDPNQDLQVVVESNFDPSLSNPELILTDEGPRGPMVPEEKKVKRYKPVKIVKKPDEQKSPMPPPSPAPPPSAVWQTFYTIPKADLKANENYSLIATAGLVTSNRVTFHTGP